MKKFILFAFTVLLCAPQFSMAETKTTDQKSSKVKGTYRFIYWVDRPKGCNSADCEIGPSSLCHRHPGDQLTGAGSCNDDHVGQCECATEVQCTTVIVDYEKGSGWWASAWYTPCGKTTESTFHANSWSNNTVLIDGSTKFRIGVAGSKNSVLEVHPTGATYRITCGGSSASHAKCSPLLQGTSSK